MIAFPTLENEDVETNDYSYYYYSYSYYYYYYSNPPERTQFVNTMWVSIPWHVSVIIRHRKRDGIWSSIESLSDDNEEEEEDDDRTW